MKKIAILGSTGSIGTQTVDILPSIEAEVVALTTNRRIGLLEEQARALHPKMVCAFDENAAKELRVKLADTDIEVLTGMDGLIACASESGADIVVTAVVGMVGLLPTLAAINAGKDIALANKETLVCAGGIVMEAAREKGVRILPVDSEHSAIFQCVQAANGNPVSKILLTASGGPFFGKKFEEMRGMTREQALASLSASSPASQHPEYCAFPGGRLWLDPGYPEVRELVAEGVAEIARDYPVDGVLFDDYFYPYPSAADGWDDSESYALYGGGAESGDFRRANISELIRLCSEAVHGARDAEAPSCVFGVSPFGIWRNFSLDPRGSDTRGFSAYDGIYADALEWVRSRTVDFLSPQIYFRRDDPAAPALTLMQWWSDALGGSGIPLIFSLADYKAAQWEDGGEIAEQELLARDIPGCIGCAHYGYGALCADDYGVRSCLSEAVMSE